jgi:hypothetical protein
LRVERRRVVEQRREDFQVERAQVVNLDRAFVSVNLAPDILQRTHPVPIRRYRVEAETEPTRLLRFQVQLFGRLRELRFRTRATLGIQPARQTSRCAESADDNKCEREIARLDTSPVSPVVSRIALG